jgi:hypothetical protein
MRRVTVILVTAAILTVLVVTGAYATLSGSSTPTASPVVSEAVAFQNMGISMSASAEPSKLDAAQAIQQASLAEGRDFVSPAAGVTVSARKVRFNADVDPRIVPTDVLAWVITVDGERWPLHGARPADGAPEGPTKYHTQRAIVIDADTGVFLQDFSYR